MVPSASARAATVAGVASEPEAAPDLSEVRDLYERGKAKFDLFDYEGAVELWTLVYSKLGETAVERQIRNDVIYNIAMAQERAFELDHDVTHLRQAVALLRKYVDEYKTLYQATPEGRKEVAGVEARIAELDQRIAEATGEAPPPTTATEFEPSEPSEPPPPQTVPKRVQVREILRNDPEIAPKYKAGKNMVVAGAVTMGVGGVLLISFVSWRTTVALIDQPVGTGEIVLASIAGGLIVTGAVLLGVGVPTRRKAIRAAESRVVWAPTFGPRGGGFTAGMRF